MHIHRCTPSGQGALADLRRQGEALGCDLVFDSGRRLNAEVGFAFLDKLDEVLALEERGDVDGMALAVGDARELLGAL